MFVNAVASSAASLAQWFWND